MQLNMHSVEFMKHWTVLTPFFARLPGVVLVLLCFLAAVLCIEILPCGLLWDNLCTFTCVTCPHRVAQSRQSARLSSSRSNWVRPPGSPACESCPLFVPGGGRTRLRQRGWADPIRTRGQTLWYSRYSTIPLRLPSSVSSSTLHCSAVSPSNGDTL